MISKLTVLNSDNAEIFAGSGNSRLSVRPMNGVVKIKEGEKTVFIETENSRSLAREIRKAVRDARLKQEEEVTYTLD